MQQSFLRAFTWTTSVLLLLAACRPLQPIPSMPTAATPAIELTGDGDALTITLADAVTTIDITSARGIGAAQVRFSPTSIPKEIVLNFHLQGLEYALLDNGAQQLEISISSNTPYVVSQSHTTAAGVEVLDANDGRRARVELTPPAGAQPVIPLQAGTIAVTLPPAFIDAEHPLLSLRWIDFYR
jgi:hypothetical protein